MYTDTATIHQKYNQIVMLIFLTPDYQTIKQSWCLRGSQFAIHCSILFVAQRRITLYYIALHRTTSHHIGLHCTKSQCIGLHRITSHYIALHIDCTALHGIVLQGKSQFAHKGESSNWGQTRNMGGGCSVQGDFNI